MSVDTKDRREHIIRITEDPKEESGKKFSASGGKRSGKHDELEDKRLLERTTLSIFRESFNVTKPTFKRKVLLLLSVLAVGLDPLFFYIPMINVGATCLKSDKRLGGQAIILRTIIDVLHLILWLNYHERCCSNRLEGESDRSTDESKRKARMVAGLIEIISIIPLPQAVTLAILSKTGSPRSCRPITLLKFSVLCQFIIRAYRIFPAYGEATRSSYTLLRNRVWVGAAFNLCLFMIASHVLGAFWYLLSVGRNMDCWRSACSNHDGCTMSSLYCNGTVTDKSFLSVSCPINSKNPPFDFGIYLSALQSNIVGSTNFPLKLGYCFWWGLRNLSSLGQNLTTSAYEWEICFSICVSILGLILFSLFIGNMQTYFQSKTKHELEKMQEQLDNKLDLIMKKQRELPSWQPFQLLSQELKAQVMSCRDDKWLETGEVNLKSILNNLPNEVSRKIKQELCSHVLSKVTLFQAQRQRAMDALVDKVKPMVFNEGDCILMENDSIGQMVFIVSGKLKKTTIQQDGSFTINELSRGDYIGEELLQEVINTPQSAHPPPASNSKVEATIKVEAFVLKAGDLKHLVKKYFNLEDLDRYKWALSVVAKSFPSVRQRKQEKSASTRRWQKFQVSHNLPPSSEKEASSSSKRAEALRTTSSLV